MSFTMDRNRQGYPSTVNLDDLPEVLRLLIVEYKPTFNDIQTIKRIRELTGISLKDAKGLIDCVKELKNVGAVDYRESFEQLSIEHKKLSEDNERLEAQLADTTSNRFNTMIESLVSDFQQSIVMDELEQVIAMQQEAIATLSEKVEQLTKQNTDLINKFVFGREVK